MSNGNSDTLAENDLLIAQYLFDEKNYPQSEIFCRQQLILTPNNAPAQALLRAIKKSYEIPDVFELTEHKKPQNNRFFIIKAWGYGFWSEGHHLASQLLLAELTNRTPIILWGVNCLFRNPKMVNSINCFFEPFAKDNFKCIPKDASFYPPKWSHENLYNEDVSKWEGNYSRQAAQFFFARTETVVVSDFFSTISSIQPWIDQKSKYYGKSDSELYRMMFNKYLKPTHQIKDIVESFYNSHMKNRNWVAVHVRGSDKVIESPQLAQTNEQYYPFIHKIIELNPTIGIFLLTDTLSMVTAYKERYGERILCIQAVRTDSTIGVHLNNNDGIAVGKEVYIDTLIATKCDYFVGNQESNVSLAISSLGDWPLGRIVMLGVSSARSHNTFIHRRNRLELIPCRLCKSAAYPQFKKTILSKHLITYYKCSKCNSLQTEFPYWLEEAYSPSAEKYDTGKASRTLNNFLILQDFFKILGLSKDDRCADYGGGTGLFSRLMRDIGYNFYNFDIYSGGEFAIAYSLKSFDRPLKLVTIFECIEHFSDPIAEFEQIFSSNADFIFGSTELYTGQNSDWGYLTPLSGQHIFFYSKESFLHIAEKKRWCVYILGNYFLLSKFPLSSKVGEQIIHWSNSLNSIREQSIRSWSNDMFRYASTDHNQVILRQQLQHNNVRIALDGHFFRFATGITRLWKNILAEWSANGFGEFIIILDRNRTAPRFGGIRYIDLQQHDYNNLLLDRKMLQDVCDRENISLFSSTYYTAPLTTPAIILIPDMIPETMNFDLNNPQWAEKHATIRYAKQFLSISNSTSHDLMRFFPEISPDRIVTTYCGTGFRTPSLEQIDGFKKKYSIVKPYFMISGVKTDYKNAILFFKGFQRLGDRRKDFAIVCTNSLPTLEPEFEACIGNASTHLLILSDDDLQCAYAGAIALVYPSRYEGFGLPILEAMACSCPVITCQNSSIVEVGGDAVIYISPDSEVEMYEALNIVQQHNIRDEYIRKGLERAPLFSWRKMANIIETTFSNFVLSNNA